MTCGCPRSHRASASCEPGRPDRISWAKFTREYRKELKMDGPIDSRSRTIKNHGQKFTLRLLARLARKGNVTILCLCAEDEKQCHRHLLKQEVLKHIR